MINISLFRTVFGFSRLKNLVEKHTTESEPFVFLFSNPSSRPIPFYHSRRSLLSTTWCLRRCWPSLRTRRTSCWSCLRISVTCSETLRCTARPSSSPAPRHPTTTHGRSRGGMEGMKHLVLELKYQIIFLPKCRLWGLFFMKERAALDARQQNVREDLKTVVRKGTGSTANAWRRGRGLRT